MPTATLINTTKRPMVINLDHPAFRARKYGFARVPVPTTVTNAKGQSSIVGKNKSIPGSITVPGGGEVKDLHPAIKNCSQVPALLKRGLKIEMVKTQAAKPAKRSPARAPKAAAAAPEGDS